MAQQRLGIIMNGVTGRMGMNQHLIRSIVAIRAQGGVALRNGDTVMPDPILVGRNEAKLAQLAKANGVDALDHRPQCRAQEPRRHAVLRCRHDQAARQAAAQGDRGGKGHLLREADRREPQGCRRRGARRQEGRHQARRGAGQALSPRPAQAQDADRLRLFRPHPRGARRVRLLGVRGRLAAGAAAVVELPQEGRRRHHPRYALPLALRARQPVRRGARASPASARPISPSAGTRTTSRTRPTSTTPPMRRSSSRAAPSPTSTAPGARACAATISSPSMSTARWARRWQACRNAGARRG